MINRRNFLKNAAGLFVSAPFVVKSEILMPVKKEIEIPELLMAKREEISQANPCGYMAYATACVPIPIEKGSHIKVDDEFFMITSCIVDDV